MMPVCHVSWADGADRYGDDSRFGAASFDPHIREMVDSLIAASGHANLQAIADDLQRANRSVASVKNPGGSDTAQNLYAASKGDKPTILGRLLANAPAAAGGVGGFVVGGPLAAFAGAVGAKTLADFRMAGIQSVDDLVNEALLNPPVARMLLAKPTTKANEAATLQILGQMIRRSVATSPAVSADGGNTEGGPIPMTPGATIPKRQPLEITVGRSAR